MVAKPQLLQVNSFLWAWWRSFKAGCDIQTWFVVLVNTDQIQNLFVMSLFLHIIFLILQLQKSICSLTLFFSSYQHYFKQHIFLYTSKLGSTFLRFKVVFVCKMVAVNKVCFCPANGIFFSHGEAGQRFQSPPFANRRYTLLMAYGMERII